MRLKKLDRYKYGVHRRTLNFNDQYLVLGSSGGCFGRRVTGTTNRLRK